MQRGPSDTIDRNINDAIFAAVDTLAHLSQKSLSFYPVIHAMNLDPVSLTEACSSVRQRWYPFKTSLISSTIF